LDFLRHSVVHGSQFYTQEQVWDYLANFVKFKHIDNVKHILVNDIFPNVGKELRDKALFLGFIINKLIHINKIPG
jgi:hypothetical protein